MLLTTARLCELNQALDAARRASTGPGEGNYCTVPHDGEGTFHAKPGARKRVGHVYPDGNTLVERDGIKGVLIRPGVHGRAGLGIDPETGEVRCELCAAKGGV